MWVDVCNLGAEGRDVVRGDGTARVELSDESEGQPATERLTLDRLDGPGRHEPLYTQRNYNPPSKTALTSSTVLRSAKNGQRSVSSVS